MVLYWLLIIVSEVCGPEGGLAIRLHNAGSNTSARQVTTAIPGSGHIMVMFPLICCYDRFGISWSSLDMLPDIASEIRALVITPAH